MLLWELKRAKRAEKQSYNVQHAYDNNSKKKHLFGHIIQD